MTGLPRRNEEPSLEIKDQHEPPNEPPTPPGEFLGMTGAQWKRVGVIAGAAGLASLALAPIGDWGLVSQACAGGFGGLVLGNGLSNKGPFSDGFNACINLAFAGAGMIGAPWLASTYGSLATAAAVAAVTGAGAAVIGSGPIRNYSTGLVVDLHQMIRPEDYRAD
jgi:hypothetical protein